jgi:acyl carrier protein
MAQDAACDVEVRVLRVLASCAGLDEGDVVPSARLGGDLGFTSLDLLELAFRLDEEFGGKIELGARADFTARQVADAVRAVLAREGSG